MRASSAPWTPRERALLALCVLALGISIAGYLDLGGSAEAGPGLGDVGRGVDSSEIENGTIRSRDIRDGGVRVRDLTIYSTRSYADIRVNPGGVSPAYGTVACNGDDRAIGGGFDIDPNVQPPEVHVFRSAPDLTFPERWQVGAWIPFSNDPTVGFASAYAVCLRD